MKTSNARVLATGFYLLEGPRWFNDELLVSDIYGKRVIRFTSPENGDFETLCLIPEQPSGLGFALDGTLRIVSMLDRKLLKWDGKKLELVADLSNYFKTEANDMAIDEQGRCYIGGFGTTSFGSTQLEATNILRVDSDGTVTVAAEGLIFPNGIIFSADAKTLFVAESYKGRVTSFPVLDNGVLGKPEVWAQFGTVPKELEIKSATAHLPIIPDGLALDTEGGIWVADAKGSGIARVLASGEEVEFVSTGDLSVYAAAFGGPNMTTLYLCASPPVETFHPKASPRSVLMSYEGTIPGVPRR